MVRRALCTIEGSFSGREPDVVVFARSTDHVAQVVKYCASHKLPVIPFGTGTGLEGRATSHHV